MMNGWIRKSKWVSREISDQVGKFPRLVGVGFMWKGTKEETCADTTYVPKVGHRV